jgi:hypothetical protein
MRSLFQQVKRMILSHTLRIVRRNLVNAWVHSVMPFIFHSRSAADEDTIWTQRYVSMHQIGTDWLDSACHAQRSDLFV